MSKPRIALGEIIRVSSAKIEPQAHANLLFNYVGLEDIESHTGRVRVQKQTPGSAIKSTKSSFRPGQILYGKLRPYLNKVHLATESGICSTDILVLDVEKSRAIPAFVSYFLRSGDVLDRVTGLMQGANLPRLNAESLLQLEIPILSLTEQAHIVRILDQTEELRRLREQSDRRTADLPHSLFRQIFGQLNQYPLQTLEDAIETFIDYRGKTPEKTTTGIPLVTAKVIKNGRIQVPNEFISESTYVKWMRRGIPAMGDVLFTTEAPMGEVAQVKDHRIALAQRVLLLRPHRKFLDGTYLTFVIKDAVVWNQIVARSSGSTVRGIRQSELRKVNIPVPPLELQQQFAYEITQVRWMQDYQSESTVKIRTLSQALLHHAFQGEL